jgi:hypothetical protein
MLEDALVVDISGSDFRSNLHDSQLVMEIKDG